MKNDINTPAVLLAAMATAASAVAGTATYTFDWYQNAAVADFPVPIALEEGRNGFTYAGFADASGGTDLRAYDSESTSLPIEIETWNPGGKSLVWVKVPSLSSATSVTLSWGDASAAAADASGMWGEAMAVMHFGDEDGLNSAHGDTLSRLPAAATVTDEKAPVGVGARFNRTGDYCTTSASSATYWPVTTNLFTISFWLRSDKLLKADDQTYLLQWGYYSNAEKTLANQMAVLFNWYANAQIAMFRTNGGANTAGSFSPPSFTFPSDDRWHHVAYTYDGTTCTAYLDGEVVKTSSSSDFQMTAWGEYDGYLSVGGTRTANHLLDGAMDEFRFERVCRSAEWIRAEVETQGRGFYAKTIPFSDYTGATLTDFPAYVHIDENMGVDIAELYNELTNGTAQVRDMRTGVLLPVEVEYVFNNDFDTSLGMWVKMPSYSSADGVEISVSLPHYVPDGAAASGNAVGPSCVWDSDDFLLVFHMNPTGYLHDVKSNVRLKPGWGNKRGECANAYPVATDGPTGPYQAYRSTTNAVQTVTPTISRAITNVYTVSWWAKVDDDEFASPKLETYAWTLLGVSGLMGANYAWTGTGANKVNIWGATAPIAVPDTGWHHYVFTANGRQTLGYRDGELVSSVSKVKDFSLSTISGKGICLMGSSNASKDAFRGKADEVRLETVCRSADWVKATYLNQLAWRDGTPWQFAPHFASDVSAVVANGGLSATATLSCRTNATVTAYWGNSDGGTDADAWSNSIALGAKADGAVTAAATLSVPGERYAVRFHAVNDFGEAWSEVRYVTMPITSPRGAEVPITVNYEGDDALTDFPLCVRIPAGNGLPDNPAKVRILDADGVSLAWEAETWNPSGESVLWVRVGEIAGTTSLTLKFHDDYPDDGAWAPDSVWSPHAYAGVWHFAESSKSGVATDDSTSFGADINSNGRNAYATNGVAGTAYHFPSNTQGHFRATAGTPFNDFGEGFTFSFWAAIPDQATADWVDFSKHELKNYPSAVGYVQYVVRYDAAAAGVVDLYPYCNGSRIVPPGLSNKYRSLDDSQTNNTSTAFSMVCRATKPDEGWHNYAFTHDGLFLAAYLDGELVNREFWPFVLNTAVQDVKLMQTAFGSNSGWAKVAKGTLDEYRVERVGRSAAWIKACYDNLKPDSTFVTVGSTRYQGTIIIFR